MQNYVNKNFIIEKNVFIKRLLYNEQRYHKFNHIYKENVSLFTGIWIN